METSTTIGPKATLHPISASKTPRTHRHPCAFRRICGTRSRRPWRISSTVAQPSGSTSCHPTDTSGRCRGRHSSRRSTCRCCVCPTELPMSTDIGRKWTVAIAICAPRRRRWGAQHVLDLCSALHDKLLDPPQIDVFADAETAARLRSDPKCSSYTTVNLHDPSDAQAAHHYRAEKSAPRLGNQPSRPGLVWADWIAEGLAGKAVRALHIVADATFDGDRPLLRVAADPNVLTGRLDLIRQDDLSVLADRVGATLLSLGSPPQLKRCRDPDDDRRHRADPSGADTLLGPLRRPRRASVGSGACVSS